MSNTSINIPVTVANAANAPTADLSNYGPKRTFGFVGPTNSSVKIFASVDGTNFPPTTATPLLTIGANQDPVTIDDLSLKYRAVPSAVGTDCSVVVEPSSASGGGGSAFLNTTVVADKSLGGAIGAASATVDAYEAAQCAQTTAGQTLTLPTPTDASASRRFYLENIGTVSFVCLGTIVQVGSVLEAIWNGSAWKPIGIGTNTGTNTIMSAAGIDVANSNGLLTQLGNPEALVPGSATQMYAGAGGFSIAVDGTGNLSLGTNGSGDVIVNVPAGANADIATNATDHSTNLGGTTGVSGTVVSGGTDGVLVRGTGAGPVRLQPGATANVELPPRAAGAGNTSTLAFKELAASGGNFVGLKAPDALAGDTTYTLPAQFPTINGQGLKSTTAGVMSWAGAVNVQANNTSAQVIADGAAAAALINWTEVTDTAGSFTPATGVFVVPATGFYGIAAECEFAAIAAIVGAEFTISVFVNGAAVATGVEVVQVAAANVKRNPKVSIALQLTAGQTVDIRVTQNSGSGNNALTAVAVRNFLSIWQTS